MLRLIKNVRIFTPDDIGIGNVLIADRKIYLVNENTNDFVHLAEVYDGQGAFLVPGFVDGLTHIVGGGGEGGFINRTPEISAEEMLQAGVTTCVGALGTDAITRSIANLLGKARELTAKGVESYFYTGSYHYPPTTLTESVETDLLYIPEVIGLGELALSDHRGSVLEFKDLYSASRKVRTTANLAGKKGVVFCHLGDEKQQLDLLSEVIENTELPASLFVPTHINRNPNLFAAGVEFAKAGGFIDFTTSTNQRLLNDGEVACAEALARSLEAGVEIDSISFSSDANASLPRFNEIGEVIGVDCGRIDSLFGSVREAVQKHNIPLSTALRCITSNPARALGFDHKGRIAAGLDADLVLINPKDLTIKQVWTRGVARLAQ